MRGCEFRGAQRGQEGVHLLHTSRHPPLALLERHHLLQMTPIRLHAREFERTMSGNSPGKRYRVGNLHAAGTVLTNVEIDDDLKGARSTCSNLCQSINIARMVGYYHDSRLPADELSQPRQHVIGSHRRGDEDTGHPGSCQSFRLADRCARSAQHPGSGKPLGDLRRFVRLRMRTQ